jgi:hypothetical protein
LGLSKDALQLVLKLLIGTIVSLQAARQSFDVDLGIGQLRFKSGRVVEFKLAAGSSSSSLALQQAAVADSSAGCSGNGVSESRLDAAALSQLGGSAGERAQLGSL